MKWSAHALRVGYDDEFPLVYNHKVGSNRFESRLPTEEFNSVYSSHKAVADKCAQTRVDGGMHFPGAIVAGGKSTSVRPVCTSLVLDISILKSSSIILL